MHPFDRPWRILAVVAGCCLTCGCSHAFAAMSGISGWTAALMLPSAVDHSHASALQSQESGGRVLSGKVASAQMLSKPETLEGKQVLPSRQLSSCTCRLLKPVHEAQWHSLAALHMYAFTVGRCTQHSLN